MNYSEHKPHPSLKDYIDHIAFNSYGIEDDNLDPCIVPDCMTEIVFNFGREYKRKTINSTDFVTIKGSHIIGVKSQPHILLENAEMETISIRVKPARLSFFTKIPMNELTDSAVPATDVFGKEIFIIEDKLKLAKDNINKVEIITKFLSDKLLSNYKQSEAVEILSSMYKTPENNILRKNSLSKTMYYKKLERLFSDIVGISPKLVGRIIRINYAIERKLKDNSLSFSELAYISGYFDQSHFIKDFIDLSNKTPKCFFNQLSSMDKVNINSLSRQFPVY
jgi:AraC-like DNA-binding protein